MKVVVDSKYGLSLESINSAPELGNTKYKKFDFNKDNYYDELIPFFYDGLPSEIAFRIKYDDDADSMSTNFADQFDETYQYGARNIENNKNYLEEFEYFAPLYIYKNKLPKNFVIFRVDGPGMSTVNRNNFKDQIVSKLKSVKVFDLTKTSFLGEWLDTNVNGNEFFPDAPLEINFQRLEFSRWNGIDYRTGGYISKSLFMDDVFEKEMEVFELERLIFDGYKKNSVVFPNILNLSFLFDDTPADANTLRKWSINRYYGFYVDEMDHVSSISPFMPAEVKAGAVILKDNIIDLGGQDPFVGGWSESRPFYVEYDSEYYKVEQFTVKTTPSVKSVSGNVSNTGVASDGMMNKDGKVKASQVKLTDVNNPLTPTYNTDQKTDTYVKKWRIIAPLNLEGKQAHLNMNSGYIDETKSLVDYNGTAFEIEDFDRSDVWLISVDGMYHNLVRGESGNIEVNSDYTFEFGKDFYRYYVNNKDPKYTKTVFFNVDENNAPKKFDIYRLKFSDIKDFDTRIVDTETSKFEYEKENELTNTYESKLYLNNLNSDTVPKQVDDFYLNDKVVRIPVSSEYTANNETFKINGGQLSPIWRKNPVYCRWAFEGSLSANDYPYTLNNSSTFEQHNRTANTFELWPKRIERNLDYFYTINSSSNAYLHHTLHVEKADAAGVDPNFDFNHDMYLGQAKAISATGLSSNVDFDYFGSIFRLKSTFNGGKIVRNTKKFSEFTKGDNSTPNYTLFRGIKFSIYDVSNVKINASGKIEIINTSTRNTFEDYKFSVILTSSDNGMQWDSIDRWELDRSYKKGDIVEHSGMFFRAVRDTVCTNPVSKLVVRSGNGYTTRNVVPAPYNLLHYGDLSPAPYNRLRFDTNFTTNTGQYIDVIKSDVRDWEIYNFVADAKIGNVMLDPIKAMNSLYNNGDVVYNNGNFYVFNNSDAVIDFWNPAVAYSQVEVELSTVKVRNGYALGAVVFFKGAFYKSLEDGNLGSPEARTWEKIGDSYEKFKWTPVGIWKPNAQYVLDGNPSFVMHNDVVYKSDSSGKTISSGEYPNRSNLWKRLYSVVPDTDLVYSATNNPIIVNYGQYYRIISNVNGSTLDNGIRVFINHRFKNVLVNIYINDNSITNTKGSDRDELYVSTSRKLTAANFIDSVNNIMARNGFSDRISYHVVSADGTQNSYSYPNRIVGLPHIIFAERPDSLKVKSNSLLYFEKNERKLKPTKSLTDGRITSPDQLNHFNNTHMAAEIVDNVDKKNVADRFYNLYREYFRHSGNYVPLFYDVELFNTDNSVEYNRIDLKLEISNTQNVRFLFESDGLTTERTYEIRPSGSYSTSVEYYSQVLSKVSSEFPNIRFTSEIFPKTKSSIGGELFNLTEKSFDRVNGIWYDRSENEGFASLVAATSSPIHRHSDTYPGDYVEFFGDTNLASLMLTTPVKTNPNSMTFEFLVRPNSVSTYNVFFGDGINFFGFEDKRAFMLNNFENGTQRAVYTTRLLEDKVWYHLCFTLAYDATSGKTTTKAYVDGRDFTEDGTLSLTHNSTFPVSSKAQFANHGQFAIGGYDDYRNDPKPYAGNFSGRISSMRFFDRVLTDAEISSNYESEHATLSIKYMSSVGDIKLSLKTYEPSLYLDFYDAFDPGYSFYAIQLGATGGNPPYEYSVNGGGFNTATTVNPVSKGSSMYIVVRDSIGLTSSSGVYLVNSNIDTPYVLTSPFAYS